MSERRGEVLPKWPADDTCSFQRRGGGEYSVGPGLRCMSERRGERFPSAKDLIAGVCSRGEMTGGGRILPREEERYCR